MDYSGAKSVLHAKVIDLDMFLFRIILKMRKEINFVHS